MWGREIEIFRRWYRDSIILDNARNQAASSSMAMLWLGEVCSIPFVLLGGYWLLIGKEPLFAITMILFFGPLSFIAGYMIRTKRDLARQREGVEPSEPTQLAIIRKSLAWGFSVGGIVFAVGFIGPIILTPEANLGPMTGIFLGPVAFVIGTFLVGIGQIRPALTLPKWGKVGYGLFLLLLLVPFALSGTDLLLAGVYSAALALFFALMAIIRWVINTISY
jgi:hypothetical protein